MLFLLVLFILGVITFILYKIFDLISVDHTPVMTTARYNHQRPKLVQVARQTSDLTLRMNATTGSESNATIINTTDPVIIQTPLVLQTQPEIHIVAYHSREKIEGDQDNVNSNPEYEDESVPTTTVIQRITPKRATSIGIIESDSVPPFIRREASRISIYEHNLELQKQKSMDSQSFSRSFRKSIFE